MRTAAIVLASIVAVLCLLVVAGVAYLSSEGFRGTVEDLAGTMLDRRVTIAGIGIEPGWTTSVALSDVTVGNPDWGQGAHFLAVDKLEISIRALPLLVGRIELPRIFIQGPDLKLERDGQGRVNWNLGTAAETAGEVAAPEQREEFPHIGELQIDQGRMAYVDAVSGLTLEGEISTARGKATEAQEIVLALMGNLGDQALEMSFRGGSLNQLRDDELSYPVDLDLRWGMTMLRTQGTVLRPLQMAGFDLTLLLQGPSLSEIFPVLGIPLPPSPSYRFEGRIGRTDRLWEVTDFTGRIGDSDVSGWVKLRGEGEKRQLQADLVSRALYFRDLAGLIGKEPAATSETASASVFPTTALADERLHAMDMDIHFSGAEIVTDALQIGDLDTRVMLVDGVIKAEPLELRIAGGSMKGAVLLSAKTDIPLAEVSATLSNVDLKPFFAGTPFVQEMGGRFQGELSLRGQGYSAKEMLSSADGAGWLGIRDGTVSGLLVEAAGLDLGEALVLLVEDARIPLRCGRADVEVSKGVVAIVRALVDTPDSILLSDGSVDLAAEQLGIRIEARAKDFSLLDLAAPVRVSGPLNDPQISIGQLAALPFFEMGEDVIVDCDALMSGHYPAVPETKASQRHD